MNFILNMKFKHFVIGLLVVCFCMMGMFTIWLYVLEDDLNDESELEFSKRILDKINETGDVVSVGIEQEVETSDTSEDIAKYGMRNDFTQLDDGTYHDFNVDRVIPPVIDALVAAESQKLPIILWWTGFTGEAGKIKRCFVGDCFFSIEKKYLNHSLAKAFLFYGTDLDIEDLPLPRKEQHEWGLLHEESPKNNGMFYHEDALEQFNHTSTFQQKSDYPIPTQHIPSEQYLLEPLEYTVAEKNKIKQEKNFSSVLYIQSGCNPPSDRDAYIQELMKYVKIDSYGKCLHNKDLDDEFKDSMTMHNKAFIKFLRQYKFMISFENAICNDYMTEKIFRTFHVGVIPIYKGAPNIKEWLPDDKSVIMVDDYQTPKDLADYINYLDSHEDEYEKYLQFKKTGLKNQKLKNALDERPWAINSVYRMSFITGFECHVCDQIHRNKKANNSFRFKGSIESYKCPKPEKYPYESPPGTEEWERGAWIWDFEDGERKAKIFKDKSLNIK